MIRYAWKIGRMERGRPRREKASEWAQALARVQVKASASAAGKPVRAMWWSSMRQALCQALSASLKEVPRWGSMRLRQFRKAAPKKI